MSSVIVTGASGTAFDAMLAVNSPVMLAYAQRHNLDMLTVRLNGPRPPSWAKIDALLSALRSYETAVWIDADVVIVNGQDNIFAAVPSDKWQGVVEHVTECGNVPNHGVWLCRRQMVPFLQKAKARTKYTDHPWWEQADMMEQLGYAFSGVNAARHVTPTELYKNTYFLPPEWNNHPRDVNRKTQSNFMHVTQYDDRLAAVSSFVDQASNGWMKTAE
jgi:hypothetical protein